MFKLKLSEINVWVALLVLIALFFAGGYLYDYFLGRRLKKVQEAQQKAAIEAQNRALIQQAKNN